MITIYHNPRCSKSREGLCLLEDKSITFETVKYLDQPLSKEELRSIIGKLNIKPIELVRQKESLWIDNYKGKTLSDEAIIEILSEHPKLIERPIVINGDKAVIGRPTANILDII